MPRRHVVRDLNDEQFTFVIESIIRGFTDRETSAAFYKEFGERLAKSSLQRWREAAGNELAERYRLARYQARQLLEDIEETDENKFQVVIRNIEDRLLTATREVIAQDPVKLLRLRLDEEKRRLKEQEIELKREQIALEREKIKGVAMDRQKLALDFMKDLLEYIGSDAEGLKWFNRHAKPIDQFFADKYGEAKA